jgi:DnaJ-class molecular chaperone
MSEMDYYNTLEVGDNATQAQIKEAYRRLAFQYHPDRNQDPGSSARMKSINEAYAVLSNPAKRRDYDVARRQFGSRAYTHFRNTYTDRDIFKGSDINRIFEEMAGAFGFRSFDEIFREAYGEGYRTFEFRRPGFSARGFVYTGGRGRPQNPPAVFGKLSRYLVKKFTGVDLPEQGADVVETVELTPQEAHDGGPYPFFYKRKSKKLVVKMPPGLREGQRIRLVEMGEEGKGSGKRGDLYLKVKIQKPVLEKIKDFFSSVKNSYNLPKP